MLHSVNCFVLAALVSFPPTEATVAAEMGMEAQMSIKPGRPVHFESLGWTELQLFSWQYDQDWDLVSATFDDHAMRYFSNLPSERKVKLRDELVQFLMSLQSLPEEDAAKRWLKLGAQVYPMNIKATLQKVASRMQ